MKWYFLEKLIEYETQVGSTQKVLEMNEFHKKFLATQKVLEMIEFYKSFCYIVQEHFYALLR